MASVFCSIYFAITFYDPPVFLLSSQNIGRKKCVPSQIRLR